MHIFFILKTEQIALWVLAVGAKDGSVGVCFWQGAGSGGGGQKGAKDD